MARDRSIRPAPRRLRPGRQSHTAARESPTPHAFSDEQQLKIDAAIDAVLAKLQLTRSESVREITGSRVLRPLSKKAYKKHFTALRYFLCLIGDFESVLMLLPQQPSEFCPAMNIESLVLFMDWKTQPAGTVMMGPQGSDNRRAAPRLNFFGEPLLADGQ